MSLAGGKKNIKKDNKKTKTNDFVISKIENKIKQNINLEVDNKIKKLEDILNTKNDEIKKLEEKINKMSLQKQEVIVKEVEIKDNKELDDIKAQLAKQQKIIEKLLFNSI